ncbi:MAG: glycosyltransferase family 39 protein [bacterium]|nr:glycosyltransferase family 39 protein [bacterium]
MPTHFFKQLQKNWYVVSLSLALILICLTRVYKLDVYPRGFFVDESSVAYNALSIALTGKDEYGIPFPVYFKAFGEYKNPILIYSQALLYSFVPATIYTARLAPALWGLAFIILTWIYTKGESTNLRLIKTILVATTPWLFHLSRVDFEVIVFPTLVLASLLPLRRFFSKRKSRDWLLFVLIISISFYSYTAARLLAPLILILAGAITLLAQKRAALKPILLGIVLSILIITPAIIWNYYYPNSLLARYELVGKSDAPIARQLKSIVSRYREHTRLSYLFEVGDNNLRHSTGKGLLPLISLPLFLIGLTQFWQKRKHPYNWFILGGLLLSPLPAAMTWDDVPHALRSILFVVFFLLVVFAGLDWTIKLKQGKRWLTVTTIIIFAEFFSYWSQYRAVYQTTNYKWFFVGDLEKITELYEQKQDFEIEETTFFGTYATVAFIYHYPPELFQRTKQGHKTERIEFIENN